MRPEQLAALKTLLGEQGAAALLATVETTDKAAQAAGVAYKDAAAAPPAPVYTLPDGTPGVIVGGTFVTLKAPMPPAQMMQAAMTEAVDAAGDVAGEAAAAGLEEGAELAEPISDDTDVMDLTVGDLKAVMSGIVEEMIAGYNAKMGEMKAQYEAMGKAFGAMQAQKDAGNAEQAAALTALQTALDDVGKRLKELEGDQPAARAGYRPSTDPATIIPPAVAGLTALKGASTPEQDAYNLIFGASAD